MPAERAGFLGNALQQPPAVPPAPPYAPASAARAGVRRGPLVAGVAVGVGLCVAAGYGIAALTGISGTPSPAETPCGVMGAMCPVHDDQQPAGAGAAPYNGSGDAFLTDCQSHDFGNGSISVNMRWSVTNHDTVEHTYRVTIFGWRGFGAQPRVETVRVPAGTTQQEMTTFAGSNAATPEQPYPQPACNVGETTVVG